MKHKREMLLSFKHLQNIQTNKWHT